MMLTECHPTNLEDAMFHIAGISDDHPIVICYCRVSTDIQRDEGHSLEMQHSHLLDDCANRYPDGGHVLFVSDDGLSGTLPYRRDGHKRNNYRPGLTLVKDLIDTGLISALGVYKCNRLTRKLRIWLDLLEDHLDRHDVLFFSASEGVDSADQSSRLLLQIMMSGAEFEREQIASAMRDGLHTRRNDGYYLGEPPYGWRWQDARFLEQGDRVNIEPVPEEAEVIRRMIDLFMSGMPLLGIAKTLIRDGVASAYGGHSWSHTTIRRILMNPTHAGMLRDGNGGLVEGRHYPSRIIEPEVFFAILAEFGRRHDAWRNHDNRDDLIFNGLLTCGLCRSKMGVSSPVNGNRTYCCRGRRAGHEHARFSLAVDRVEQRLEHLVLQCIRDTRVVHESLEALHARDTDVQEEARRLKRQLARRLKQNEQDICTWASRLGSSKFDQQNVDAELEFLADEVSGLREDLRRLEQDTRERKSRAGEELAADELIRTNGLLWESATQDEKRELISTLVQSIVCEPTENGIVIRADMMPIGRQELCFKSGIRSLESADGQYVIAPSLLKVAHCLLQKLSTQEIAAARGIRPSQVYTQKSQMTQLTNSSSIEEALDKLMPLIRRMFPDETEDHV